MISLGFTSEYFLGIGWKLVEALGEDAGTGPSIRWRLVPLPSSREGVHQFESLGAIWRWWKCQMRRYLLIHRCYDLILARYEAANIYERSEIIEYAARNGVADWMDVFDQIEVEASSFIYRKKLQKGWVTRMHGLSGHSPELSHYGFYQVLASLLSSSDFRREQKRLDERTPRAWAQAKATCARRI